MVLPNGTGKTQRVLVFARGAKAEEAKAAGADFVGEDELVAKINGGWLDFDVCCCNTRHDGNRWSSWTCPWTT